MQQIASSMPPPTGKSRMGLIGGVIALGAIGIVAFDSAQNPEQPDQCRNLNLAIGVPKRVRRQALQPVAVGLPAGAQIALEVLLEPVDGL